jgi:hypothetical protein
MGLEQLDQGGDDGDLGEHERHEPFQQVDLGAGDVVAPLFDVQRQVASDVFEIGS